MAQKIDLIIDQGTTYSTQFTITDANSTALNFTGYNGASQMRKHYSSNNYKHIFTKWREWFKWVST